MKLCDGVYAYIWRGVFENNCNMYYFGEPLNIRFDSMRSDGLNPDDITTVISTHSHPDHFEGCSYFMDGPAKVGMHRDEIAFLNEVGPQFFRMMGMEFPSFSFGMELDEGPLVVNGVQLEVFLTPGHSPGSVCVYWKDKKVLVCGDLIFRESVGRTDFPGGDSSKLKASIERMAGLDIEYLLTGHMDYVSGGVQVKKNFDVIRRYIFPML